MELANSKTFVHCLGYLHSIDNAEVTHAVQCGLANIVNVVQEERKAEYEILIGRSSNCDIVLSSKDVSSTHARIRYSVQELSNGSTGETIALMDTSLNGTFLNGVKLIHGEPIAIYNNDLVCFGANDKYIFKSESVQQRPGAIRNIFDQFAFAESDLLGTGSFGSVYKARDRDTGATVAVKIIYMKDKKSTELINKEVETLRKCEHPNIMRIYDQFVSNEHTCLVLEYVSGGDLYSRLSKSPQQRFSEIETAFYFVQLLSGIDYLHSIGVIHRDIKLENILISSNDTVKIADFGLSKFLGDELFTKTVCGTPQYVAPEILESKKRKCQYNNLVDMWSCGVVLFTCLNGYYPFEADDSFREIHFRKDSRLSEYAMDLIQLLLKRDPSERLSAKKALNHIWVSINNHQQDLGSPIKFDSFEETQESDNLTSMQPIDIPKPLYGGSSVDRETILQGSRIFFASQLHSLMLEEEFC